MKTLLVIRHAKSDWSDSDLSDHDRPLNKRGEHDAPIMGNHLRALGIKPDAILSSTANRALSTAVTIAGQLDFPATKIIESRDWYLASAKKWLSAVQSIDESASTALIFGHNPGMHEFSETIVAGRAKIDQFPTLAVAHLTIDVEYWGNVEWGSAKLVDHFYPKKLN